ncbi:ribosome silencing factor [Jannaschia formosa]|uniref:ribosome silencing factor n=1 Tax=Jannaschia formosa TaxID=2259592 RepID=UPI00351FF89C
MPGHDPGATLFQGPHGPPKPEDRTLTADTLLAQEANTTNLRAQAGRSDEILQLVLQSLDDDKAEDVAQIDLRGKSSVADWMVVCSGRSTRQVTSIAEKLSERLKPILGQAARTEGKDQGDWVLVDAGDVIVHVFRPEVREFYQIEKMWQDPEQAPKRPN